MFGSDTKTDKHVNNMFDVSNVMQTDVVTVQKSAPIYEAIKTLVVHDITGLPVVDENMTLVGIITEKDILKLLSDLEVLRMLSNMDKSTAKVEDFMTKDVVTFGLKSNLLEICDCLMQNNFRRVPVVEEGKVIGIISRTDIIAYILKLGGEHEFM